MRGKINTTIKCIEQLEKIGCLPWDLCLHIHRYNNSHCDTQSSNIQYSLVQSEQGKNGGKRADNTVREGGRVLREPLVEKQWETECVNSSWLSLLRVMRLRWSDTATLTSMLHTTMIKV